MNPSRARIGVFMTSMMMLIMAPNIASASLFDIFYVRASRDVNSTSPIDPEIVTFVTKYFAERLQHPIHLDKKTIDDAVHASADKVCSDLKENRATPNCLSLQKQIADLVAQERDTQQLADDLLALSLGSELAIADEPHRALTFGPSALSLTALWTGTGSSALGWPDAAKDPFKQLAQALSSELDDEDKILTRFHFGYFRRLREEEHMNPQPEIVGPQTEAALKKLSDVLHINPQNARDRVPRIYTTPRFEGSNLANIVLWAREDDLGLQWIYPTHEPRFDILLAGSYPKLPAGTGAIPEFIDALSMPFSYTGATFEVPNYARSPLCSRPSGRLGYLCRPIIEKAAKCPTSASDEAQDGHVVVTLTTCDETNEVHAMPETICDDPDLRALLSGSGATASGAMAMRLCDPGMKIASSGTIIANSCYIAGCLAQSFDEHTLNPSRNAVVPLESQMPYLACMRPDPKLGLLALLPPSVSSAIPIYRGNELIPALDRAYCETQGLLSPGVSALCRFQSLRALTYNVSDFLGLISNITRQQAALDAHQQDLVSIAPLIGQRAAMDQAAPVYRTAALALGESVQAISNVFTELQRAPVTTEACPWRGEFCTTECNDDRDNDGDGRIDFPADKDCSSPVGESESAPPPSSESGDSTSSASSVFSAISSSLSQ
jgi:hypothetical protein